MYLYVDLERRFVKILSYKKNRIFLICLMFYIIILLVNNLEEIYINLRIMK